MSEQIQESWPIPETMVDGITGRLRRAIITGTIRPGERIRVAELERKFGVSHIPIREALRRLQSEGFVEISPRRTTIAAGVDLEPIPKVVESDESFVIRYAAPESSTGGCRDVET
jgi:DNA-binding GntR family transcriptional regulator